MSRMINFQEGRAYMRSAAPDPLFQYVPFDENNPHCAMVVLSARAYADIIAEAAANGPNETGLAMIGKKVGKVWFVYDCIPGGQNAHRSKYAFSMDVPMVNYLMQYTARRYKFKAMLVGFEHQHPESYDQYSITDFAAFRDNLKNAPLGLITGLVNKDPDFRIAFHYVRGNTLMPIPYLHGDEYFPKGLMDLADPEALAAQSGFSMRIIDRSLNSAVDAEAFHSVFTEASAEPGEQKGEAAEAEPREIKTAPETAEPLPEEKAETGAEAEPEIPVSQDVPAEQAEAPAVSEQDGPAPEPVPASPGSRILLDRTEEHCDCVGGCIHRVIIHTVIEETTEEQKKEA